MNELLLSSSSELPVVDGATMGRADTTVATPSKKTLTAVEKRIAILLLSLVVVELGCVGFGAAACLVG